jgi:hypothetical protein
MTKERELLIRALEDWDFSDKFETLDPIFEEIRTYLSTPSDDAEEPEAKPVLYIKEQELLYIQVLKQEGLAQEWKSNLGFVKEAGDVGLYLHPPRPVETEADHERNIAFDDEVCPVCGYYCNGKGGFGCIDKPVLTGLRKPPKPAEPARKPMTAKEMLKGIDADTYPYEEVLAFVTGIRYAEKHHGITDADV